MSPRDLETPHKVDILLQQQQIAVKQMEAIKNEEMSWLKVFLLFYGATVAWSVSRWFLTPGSTPFTPKEANSELIIIFAVLLFSFVATAIFTFLFTQTRKSYYGVRGRLDTIQKMLCLTEENTFGEGRVFDAKQSIVNIKDKQTWNDITKPNSSFLTRMVYLFGANIAVLIIMYLSMIKIGKDQSLWLLAFCVAANATIFLVARFFDYHHFVKKAPS